MIAQGKIIGSGDLNGKMLDLGLLKISSGGVFLYLAPPGGSNHAGPYHNPILPLSAPDPNFPFFRVEKEIGRKL